MIQNTILYICKLNEPAIAHFFLEKKWAIAGLFQGESTNMQKQRTLVQSRTLIFPKAANTISKVGLLRCLRSSGSAKYRVSTSVASPSRGTTWQRACLHLVLMHTHEHGYSDVALNVFEEKYKQMNNTLTQQCKSALEHLDIPAYRAQQTNTNNKNVQIMDTHNKHTLTWTCTHC